MEQMNILYLIRELGSCLFLPLMGYICKLFLDYWKGKKLGTYLDILYEEIKKAVKAVYQAQVKDIKSTSMWTSSKQKEVKELAKSKALHALSVSIYKCLKAVNPELEDYIDTLIETILYDLKENSGRERT